KILHYYLDDPKHVGFVAISNHPLDAAKANRAINVYRPSPSLQDLKSLAAGCLQRDERSIDTSNLDDHITAFCEAYSFLENEVGGLFARRFKLRDLYHFIRYLRRKGVDKDDGILKIDSNLVLRSLERNFNGIPKDEFKYIATKFFWRLRVNL